MIGTCADRGICSTGYLRGSGGGMEQGLVPAESNRDPGGLLRRNGTHIVHLLAGGQKEESVPFFIIMGGQRI